MPQLITMTISSGVEQDWAPRLLERFCGDAAFLDWTHAQANNALPANGAGANGWRGMRTLAIVSWRLASMLVTALTLIGVTDRLDIIDWRDVFAEIARLYNQLMEELRQLISIALPFDVPELTADAILLYMLTGHAMTILNMFGELTSEGGVRNSSASKMVLMNTLVWPYVVCIVLFRALKDVLSWAGGKLILIIPSFLFGVAAFVFTLSVALIIQSCMFLIALIVNLYL